MFKLLSFSYIFILPFIYIKCEQNTSIIVRFTNEPASDAEIGFVMPSERHGGVVLFRLYTIYRICQYLILQSSHDPSLWNPSKGRIRFDHGENELEAGIRELREETGIPRSDLKFFPSFHVITHYKLNGILRRNTFFLAELINPGRELLLSEEHLDYKWATFPEVVQLSKAQYQTDVLTACNEHLKNLRVIDVPPQEQGGGNF